MKFEIEVKKETLPDSEKEVIDINLISPHGKIIKNIVVEDLTIDQVEYEINKEGSELNKKVDEKFGAFLNLGMPDNIE